MRKRRVQRIVGLGVIMLLAWLAVVCVAWQWGARRELAAERARVPGDEPLTLAGLEAYYPYPEGPNAADAYADAAAALSAHSWPGRHPELLLGGESVPVMPQRLARALAYRAWAVLGDYDAAAAMGRAAGEAARFEVGFDHYFFAPLPHLQGLQRMAEAREHAAFLLAGQGRVDAALAEAEAILGLADHLNTEPIVTSQCVRRSLHRRAVSSIEVALARAYDPTLAPRLDVMQGRLLHAAGSGPMRRGLIGDRAMIHSLLTEGGLSRMRALYASDL